MCCTRLVAIGALALAGLNLGCGDSPASPTPVPVPPVVFPAPAGPPALNVRSVFPSAGPLTGGDYVRALGDGFQFGSTVTIDGAVVDVMRVSSTFIEFRTRAHAAGSADVTVSTPDGQSKTLTASYRFAPFSIVAGASAVAPGGILTVSWRTPSGRGCDGGGDWIAIYKVGAPDQTGAANGHSDLWFDHVCGASSGVLSMPAPTEPGVYEFRFMVGDGAVARSQPITVG
jgi:hypothetical protein